MASLSLSKKGYRINKIQHSGFPFHLISARWIKDGPPNGAALRVEILPSDPNLVGCHVDDLDKFAGKTKMCGVGGPAIPGKMTSKVVYCEA